MSYFEDYFDKIIFIVVILLVAIGLVSIYSSTIETQPGIFYKQLGWAAVGLICMLMMLFIPLRVLQQISWWTYFPSLILLVAVLVFGKRVYGSLSWFGIGGVGIQPSEIAKVTTFLALAGFLSKTNVRLNNLKDVLIAGAIVAGPVCLIMLQPDFGTALTFVGTFVFILYWGNASQLLILALISPVIVAIAALIGPTAFIISLILVGVVLYLAKENRLIASLLFGLNIVIGFFVQSFYLKLPLYQQKRISTFLDPNNDPLGAGYNVIQAKVAIGSGGIFGKGFMQGTQTQLSFIPKQWTDFIFCVFGEEFGFVGASLVLILFAILIFHGLSLSTMSKNKFGSFLALSFTTLFAIHTFINIGMSIGLIPVIGIPLPFLSYGGSALVSYFIIAGILMNVYANRKQY